MLRRAVGVALFMAAICATMVGVREFTPEPYIPLVSEKLARLDELRDEVDVLFVGSSLVYRHLSPVAFDRKMASRGQPTRSFNLGLPGALNTELLHLLRRVRDMQLPRLRYVIIETGGWDESLEAVNVRTPRVVYWHELDETRRAVKAVLSTRDSPLERLDQARLHAFAFLINRSGVGRLRLAFTSVIPSPQDTVFGSQGLGPANDGFIGLKPAEKRVRQKNVETVAAILDKRLQRRRLMGTPDVNANALSADHIEMFTALNSAIRDLGAEPIQVVSPIIILRRELQAAVAAGVVPVAFEFNDPNAYPEFYTLEARADQVHLNHQAAAQYSRLVATRLAAHLRTAKKRKP